MGVSPSADPSARHSGGCQHVAAMDASPFRDLPTELVLEVFSYIAVRPRLMVVRLVCSSWNALVMRSISALHVPAITIKSRMLDVSKFPGLTELSLSRGSCAST